MKASGEEAAATTRELVSAQANKKLPPPVKDPKVVGPLMKSVGQQCTAIADKFNEPGRFTAMIGFEWTSVPGGNNLHGNVMFRDGKPLSKDYAARRALGSAAGDRPDQGRERGASGAVNQ